MTLSTKLCWAVLLGIGLFILGMMMANGQPVPPKPRPVLRSPHDSVLVSPVITTPSQGATNDLPIVLPTSTNAIWWNLQESIDLKHWTTTRSNITGIVVVTNTGDAVKWYRTQGRLQP